MGHTMLMSQTFLDAKKNYVMVIIGLEQDLGLSVCIILLNPFVTEFFSLID